MKKLTLTSIALLTVACFASAEPVNLGNYFSLNTPRSWRVTANGMNVHAPDDYVVYKARGASGAITISVLNLPEEQTHAISYESFNSWTEADLSIVAQYNQQTGYTQPVVKKITVNGIPILLFKSKATDGSGINRLSLELWPNGKHFVVQFFYFRGDYNLINNIIDSMKLREPPPTLAPQDYNPGFAGEV